MEFFQEPWTSAAIALLIGAAFAFAAITRLPIFGKDGGANADSDD